MKQNRTAATLLILLASFGLVACPDDGPLEEAGETADEAIDDAADAVEDAADDVKDAGK